MKQTACLILLLVTTALNAQKVMDLLHNKYYEFQNRLIKPTLDKTWLRDEMEFTCYHFNDGSTPAIKKLNAGMVSLCTAQLETEDRYVKLEREAVLRLETYNGIVNSRNTGNYGSAGRPRLKHIACEIISVAAGKALIEMDYTFEYATPNRNGGRLDVKQYHLADIATGSIIPWKPSVNPANNTALRNLIKETFNSQYLAGTSKIMQERGGNTAANKELAAGNTFEKIDLRYADFYWYKSGLMVQFQEYAPGTEVFSGRYFRLFFNYEDALKITALMPEFAYINNLPKVRHNFKNAGNDDVFHISMTLRSVPTPESFAKKYNGVYALKSLYIVNNHIRDDGSVGLMGDQKIIYGAGGLPLSSISHDDTNRVVEEVSYLYDGQGRLLETIKTDYWKKENTRRYSYDDFGNLSASVEMDPYATETKYYFYNGNNVYAYTHTLFSTNRNEYTYTYELDNGTLCFDKLCYAINAAGSITGLLSTGSSTSQQLGFDDKGRLTEFHFDRDRDNYYFYYDEQDRFSRMQYYETSKKKQETIFYYNANSTLPIRIFKEGVGTKTEQLFTWDFKE